LPEADTPSPERIFAVVVAIMQSQFDLDESELVPGAHLVDDLDLDSIDGVDLSVKAEEELGVEIQPEDLGELQTLQDVVDLLHRLVTRAR